MCINCKFVIFNISIHSLRMEGDTLTIMYFVSKMEFQSTPSAWRETKRCRKKRFWTQHFNPLPPHGGRLKTGIGWIHWETFQSTPSAWRETRFSYTQAGWHVISIHSLRMEGDCPLPRSVRQVQPISIHSLRMEGDIFIRMCLHDLLHFNPLPPHGGRLCKIGCSGSR